jgi:DNA-binding NarL/FixJ family response regulator
VRILVVDDNALIRLGLRASLDGLEDVEQVLEAENGQVAVQIAARGETDIVLLDVAMPVMDGITALPLLLAHAKVVMLTHTDDLDVVGNAMTLGASGFIIHGSLEPVAILSALRACLAGGTVTAGLSPWEQLVPPTRPAHPAERPGGLSDREGEIMDEIARGLANPQIAARLFVSEKTVKNHINSIFAKLGVSARGQAIALWLGSNSRPGGPE